MTRAKPKKGVVVKLYELAIATAAVIWPLGLAAQGLGGSSTGTRLGIPASKAVGAPSGSDAAPSALFAGADTKIAAPGEITLPGPEMAEPVPSGGPAMVALAEPATVEPATETKSAETAALAAGTADAMIDPAFETGSLTVLPAVEAAPAPPPEIEIGGDTAQAPALEMAALDGNVAAAETAPLIASDTGGAGEELSVEAVEDAAAVTRPDLPEIPEPTVAARAVVTRPDRPVAVEDPAAAGDAHTAQAPFEAEEARELAGLVQVRAGSAPDAELEPETIGSLVEPGTDFADAAEEVVTQDEALMLAALADDPTREFEEKSMTDPNEIACLEMLGAPDAGVPASAALAAEKRTAMAAAASACEAAAEGFNPAPEVFYHAAEVALAKRDSERAFALFEQAAEAGLGAAVTKLGDFYLFGAAPSGRDVERAVTQFEAATALGDAAGMTSLAMMYRAAIGVPQDSARMIELLTRAAEQGYHFAQYRLAQTYLTGEGIPGRADPALGIPDPVRATRWFTAAADAGNIEAALELAGLYADPASGLPDNPAEQARLTKMAADTGLPAAIATMGALYEMGRGVEYSPELAAEYYVRAVASGEVSLEDLRPGAPPQWDRPTAMAFQTALAARGVYDGVIDGLVGGGTLAAARALAEGG